MQRSARFFILLAVAFLCNNAEGSDCLELPRKIEQTPAFKAEEINIGGQQRHRILTEHYDITAFRSEDGILAGERLEHLFQVWQLLSAEVHTEAENEPAQRRHRVILYRDKQEYAANLQRLEPNIERTNGYYSAPRKTAYFFSTDTKILFHEGTHQILMEHFFREKAPQFRNNFWVVEGMALFMETLKIEEERYKIGDILNNRLYAAKKYQFEQNYNVPIRKLTAMSPVEMQVSADIAKIYSQSATLVHWLMFAEEGRFRKPLFELLRRTYLDSVTPETLSELTGLSYDELDKKYVELLKTIPE